MPNIVITAEAHAALHAARDPSRPWHETAVNLLDGTFMVPLSDDTFERLNEAKFCFETHSETIIRLFATRNGKN